jgi:glycosyltransferase
MRVSIITVVYNGAATIADTVESVINQSYPDVEYILIDGLSQDGTLKAIDKYQNHISQLISEADNGLFEALNKGIKRAQGDIIGILHADDVYENPQVIEKVCQVFASHEVDSCYGDLLYVDKNHLDKVIRYWRSSNFQPGIFRYGWMPPHPTFFVKKEIYEKYGYFKTNFKISADYELVLRFLEVHQISTYFLPEILIRMRWGGTSNGSLRNLLTKISEDYRAWKINNLKGGLAAVFLKSFTKIPQLLIKPNKTDFTV